MGLSCPVTIYFFALLVYDESKSNSAQFAKKVNGINSLIDEIVMYVQRGSCIYGLAWDMPTETVITNAKWIIIVCYVIVTIDTLVMHQNNIYHSCVKLITNMILDAKTFVLPKSKSNFLRNSVTCL